MITITGTLGAVASAVFLDLASGHLFWGAFAVWMFVMLDMLDGAMARVRSGRTVWGAVLDSAVDRVADAAIFAGLAWVVRRGRGQPAVRAAALLLVLGGDLSYIKARAEGLGLPCDVGIVERTERLIIVLVCTGLDGLGIPYPAGGLWVIAVLAPVTVVQRNGRPPHRARRDRPAVRDRRT